VVYHDHLITPFSIISTCLTFMAFIVFACDKPGATMKGWRISETVLLLFAAYGPCGPLIAMAGFRD
jgi:uncharacterized membrane protein YsdA (DUF1294 family)